MNTSLSNLFSRPAFWLAVALLLLPLMLTNESLWLDEGDTALYALQPDFSSWWQYLRQDHAADCQMPLAMLFAWLSGQVLGVGEGQLRAVNLLWGIVALAGMYRVGRRLQLPWLPLLLAIQPYFWFYQNEARPYALQLAGGTWLLAALVECYCARAAGTAWAWLLAGAAFFLFSATMLAPITVAAAVLAISFTLWQQGWKPARKAGLILLGGLTACLPLGIYYLTTLLRGAKGAQLWHVDLKFMAYVVYELTGMGGIGLSTQEIRELARSPQWLHTLPAHAAQLLLPMLVFGLLVVILGLGLRAWARSSPLRVLTGLIIVLAFTGGVFVAVSLVLQKAFWARHFAPVFPFYVTLLGLAFSGLAATRPKWRWLPLPLCGLLLVSALNFRFAPSLRKEDYRSAAAFVRPLVAADKNVWWVAGGLPARYYGLNCTAVQPEAGKVLLAYVDITPASDLHTRPLPDVIVYNKPYIYDGTGKIQALIQLQHYEVAARFQEFVVWTNAGAAQTNRP